MFAHGEGCQEPPVISCGTLSQHCRCCLDKTSSVMIFRMECRALEKAGQ